MRGKWKAIVVTLIALLILVPGSCPSLVQAAASPASLAPPAETAPLNPDFLRYQEDLAQGKPSSWEGTQPLGAIPSPMDTSYLTGSQIADFQKVIYPSIYDLRPLGKLTPVKNQNPYGTCWSFSALASLESCLKPGETWDFSEDNMVNVVYDPTSGFDFTPTKGAYEQGGNSLKAMAYLTRWSGPVLESADPYPTPGIPTGLPVQKHVQDVLILPPRAGATDNANVKGAIMTYGAVADAFWWDVACYSPTTFAFYYEGVTRNTNHLIDLVGWDDNFDRNLFPTTPAGDGAFLVRNSWGSEWGDGGYFYISYYDPNLGDNFVVFNGAEPTSNYQRVYQYDPLGSINNIGFGSNTAWCANRFTASASEDLSAVGFYAETVNTSYELAIYGTFNSGTFSDLLGSRTGTCTAPGYHTISLNSPIALTAGQGFAVVLKLTTPGYNFPIAQEAPLANYSSHATANPGESYVSSNGITFTDLTSYYPNTNACIKAFTRSAGPADSVTITNLPYTLNATEHLACSYTAYATDSLGHTLSFSLVSGPGSINSSSGLWNWSDPTPANSYTVRIKAQCSQGVWDTKDLTVVVTGSSGTSVWPGDADNSGTVNVLDFTRVFLHWGKTGTPRTNASTLWRQEICPSPWTPPAAVYADCDGQGSVNQSDFNVILSNWGLNHALGLSSENKTFQPEGMTVQSLGQKGNLQSISTLQPSGTGLSAALDGSWTTILNEGFEGAFPSGMWQVGHWTSDIDAIWSRTNQRTHGGSWSGYCVGGGSQGVSPPGPYPNSAASWMIWGPFSLSDASQARVNWWTWFETEQDYDWIGIYTSTNGIDFNGTRYSGDSSGWTNLVTDLPAALMGQGQVWIAFIFTSDDSYVYEGAYLDDILLEKYTSSGPILPTVSSEAAGDLGQMAATLHGTVNPNGSASQAWFEWGSSASYGNSTTHQAMGSGSSAVPFSAPLSGLTANSTYHFRAVASNAAGTSYGTDRSFTTLAPSSPRLFLDPASRFVSSPQSDVVLTVRAEALGNQVNSLALALGWNPGLLSLNTSMGNQGIELGSLFAGGQAMPVLSSGRLDLAVGMLGGTVNGNGEVARLHFRVADGLAAGTPIPIAFSASPLTTVVAGDGGESHPPTTGSNLQVSGATQMLSYNFGNGWNLIGIPLVTPLTPVQVFGSLGNYYLFEWNPLQQTYLIPPSLALGKAYWLRVFQTVTGFTISGDQGSTKSVLLSPGWNMIASPLLANVNWNDLRITKGAETKTIHEAALAGWMQEGIWRWDGTTYRDVKTNPGYFAPGVGTWAKSFYNLEMRFEP